MVLGQLSVQEIYAVVGLTSEQMRAWPRMGSRQHLACWPWAAQMSMNWLVAVGVVGAGAMLVSKKIGRAERGL